MPRSLQGRMLLLSAAGTLLALAVAGWAIVGVLERFVIEGLDRRLDAQIALLASAVGPDGTIDRAAIAQRRGALEQGPGWRWRISGGGQALGSADFPRLDALPGPPGPAAHRPRPDHDEDAAGPIHPLEGAERDGGRVHARQLVLATPRGALTITAAAPPEVVRRPIRAALWPLLATFGTLAALLAIAAVVQLRLGLRPLRRLRDQVAALRTGSRTAIDEDQPSEVRPLALELNALARDNQAALQTARQSAANLAHALKTPVATLALDTRGDPALAAQVARLDATIRHHLGRARAAAANARAATPLAPVAVDVAAAVERIHAGRALRFALAVPPALSVAIDPQDLSEMLGNLIDNAARFARTTVSVSAEAAEAQRRITVTIADDGPGLPAAERSRIVQPGVRLDERGDGHGFGLAIVAELAALYGGALHLDDAPHGGLRAAITLPAA